MGTLKSLVADIQEEIQLGVLSFAAIAQKYEVPMSWVNEAWEELCEQEAQSEPYHDELERDHDEPYVPDEEYYPDPDSWYEAQYELEDY